VADPRSGFWDGGREHLQQKAGPTHGFLFMAFASTKSRTDDKAMAGVSSGLGRERLSFRLSDVNSDFPLRIPATGGGWTPRARSPHGSVRVWWMPGARVSEPRKQTPSSVARQRSGPGARLQVLRVLGIICVKYSRKKKKN
jgi:hypothetical protein